MQKFYFLYQAVFAKSNAVCIVTDAPKRSDNTELDNNKLNNNKLNNNKLNNNKLNNNKRRCALSCEATPAPALPPLLYEYYFSST